MSIPRGTLHHDSSGEVFTLAEVTAIGRNWDSGVPIPDPRVSRRHAMIRRQDDGFWFFDLGSGNGSLINGRRVTTSQLLSTGDMILLVSDIQGFTAISETLTPDQLAPIIGSRYSRTEAILNGHGANLDKFIGDCVLAYWLDTSSASRLAALKAAHAMRIACDEVLQQEHRAVLEPCGLRFGSGAAVHLRPAAYGVFSPREFTLLGDAVNLAFRLEVMTRTLGQHLLVNSDLLDGWSAGLSCCRRLGAHPVKGSDQLVEVYALERDPGKIV